MMRQLRLLLSMLLIGATAAVSSSAASMASVDVVEQGIEERQILVMLHMAPAHYRPNSNYGGSYGDTRMRAARERVAKKIAERYGVELTDSWPMPLLGVECFVMLAKDVASIDTLVAAISKEPGVAWSQPMYSYMIATPPSGSAAADPLFAAQPTAQKWRLADLQRRSTGRGMRIAIVDSKVDVTHPDLSGQFVANLDFVRDIGAKAESHGTQVAGIIGAKAGNGIGIAGVAPGAKLMALRACSEIRQGEKQGPTLCYSLALAQAIQYAINNDVDVINLSLAGPDDLLLNKLLDVAIDRDIAVVVAFDHRLPKGGFPATLKGVIPVADDALQSVPEGVYAAPGRDLPTTQPGGGWSLVNGTSFAVAQVSGLVALAGETRGQRTPAHLVRKSDGSVEACATVLGPRSSCP